MLGKYLSLCYIYTRRERIWAICCHRWVEFTDKRTDVWSRPLCINAQIFSPKKTVFSPIKSTFQNFFDFYLPLCYATFQCGPYNILKEFRLNFFCPWKLEKTGLKKLLIISPNHFLSKSSPAHSPELIFHIIGMSQDSPCFLFVKETAQASLDGLTQTARLREFLQLLQLVASR